MFFDFVHAAWRSLLCLALGAAPYAAPLDSPRTTSIGVAVIRLILVIATVAAVILAVRACRRWRTPLAVLVAVTLCSAIACTVMFSGDDGPLARATFYMLPVVWTTLAAVVSQLSLRALARTSAQVVATVVFLVAGVASGLAARDRFEPEAMQRVALSVDPGSEPAAIAVAARTRAAGNLVGAWQIASRCALARSSACVCGDVAMSHGLDAGYHAEALAISDAQKDCKKTALYKGLRAEALIGTMRIDEGLLLAEDAQALDPNEPHAVYAHAWGLRTRNPEVDIVPFAKRAVALGRGAPAHLLYGLVLFEGGELDEAQLQFEHALRLDPSSARASFDVALVAHRKHRYREAREGYLRTLRIDPMYADARLNLALLTLDHGALAEAEHHLDLFAVLAPKDSRIASVRARLATGIHRDSQP